jgi:putative hemolysin
MKHAALIAALALTMAACSQSKPVETPAATPAAATAPAAAAPASNDPPPTTAANPVPNPAEDACNKAAYAAIIGTTEKDPSVPAAGPNVRRIHPGDQVTMDFRADRLNIDIDAKGIITSLRCG